LRAEDAVDSKVVPLFDWDLVSLEQNNPRYNASVLSGFHSIRSPGVTPSRGWKTGLGMLYSQEERVAEGTNTKLFSQEQVLFNPKINRGFLGFLEAGAGFEATYTNGRDSATAPGGGTVTSNEDAFEASSVDAGIKWAFLQLDRLRLALSFDSRIAINRGAFGTLPKTLYNLEIDGDFALTSRLLVISNLQYVTTDEFFDEEQIVFDLAASYSFHDRFRGMLFGTLSNESEADGVLFFLGIAGQYIFEQHSFTLALDLQINEARRDIRTQKQVDVEISYAYTF
jgi:hypothetical protein